MSQFDHQMSGIRNVVMYDTLSRVRGELTEPIQTQLGPSSLRTGPNAVLIAPRPQPGQVSHSVLVYGCRRQELQASDTKLHWAYLTWASLTLFQHHMGYIGIHRPLFSMNLGSVLGSLTNPSYGQMVIGSGACSLVWHGR